MYKNQTSEMVVPTYNEEYSVGRLGDTISELVDRISVVGDCSTNETWKEIRRRIRRDENEFSDRVTGDCGRKLEQRFVPIRHEGNCGVGSTINIGYHHYDRPFVVTLDSVALFATGWLVAILLDIQGKEGKEVQIRE